MVKRTATLLAAWLLMMTWGYSAVRAAPNVPISRTQKVTLKVSTSRTHRFTEKIGRIHVIDPKVADLSKVTRTSVTVKALALGQTNVHVVFKNHQVILLITVVR